MRKQYQPQTSEIRLSSVLHALSDPRRLQIVLSLKDEAEESCTIYHDLMPKSTLTHHLKVLREAGVAKVRIEGTQHFYSLRTDDLELLFPGLMTSVLNVKPELIE
ncbi:ArsR/SmtB family transcription factor [Paenibacillus sacheonensis]|uniref:Metalloregulator ArsR/SmtB family transcription factor n=1 Tax=Paenibacillus sacheonensis TaxID=742054 RepID=A0A7X5C1F3_9BACL|nr:metalloregulator ArsR/SmtB family transcription factor [Paenibacillus sacheonensis]MBM7565015.1 DNA-binding transcriptional ArsR family regulator [Paenibacillus sacheonensis]NBC70200.1 metalloregulator ArsR/SmtB family transcription factor [Paenibacillus sacheonensis]